MTEIFRRENEILVAGHRGAKTKYPENTMLSFKKAVAAGVDMLELDLNMTRDGSLVVIHDTTLDRTTDGSGPVRDFTLAEIKSLDAGSSFSPEFKGLTVPSFDEFLEEVSGFSGLLLNVEIKDKTLKTVDMAISALKKHRFEGRYVIACFDAKIIKYAARECGVPVQGFVDELHTNFEAGKNGTRSYLFSVGIPMRLLSRELCDEYKREGIAPWSWPVDDEESALKSIEAGIPLCTSNDPERILPFLREKGFHR